MTPRTEQLAAARSLAVARFHPEQLRTRLARDIEG